VALLTRNRPSGTVADARDRAVASAQRAVPAAKDAAKDAKDAARDAAQRAVPAAKDVSTAVRRSAEDAAAWARPRVDDAAAWAKPKVDDARAWAAPRLERSGIAVQETIAPAIADAMVSAARAIDVKSSRSKRRWAKSAAITLIVAALASAGAAIAMRRRSPAPVFPPVDPDSPVDPGYGEPGSIPLDPEVNGRPQET
jgi:hypothetical protein